METTSHAAEAIIEAIKLAAENDEELLAEIGDNDGIEPTGFAGVQFEYPETAAGSAFVIHLPNGKTFNVMVTETSDHRQD